VISVVDLERLRLTALRLNDDIDRKRQLEESRLEALVEKHMLEWMRVIQDAIAIGSPWETL